MRADDRASQTIAVELVHGAPLPPAEGLVIVADQLFFDVAAALLAQIVVSQ
jgi:hypothetical protein